jgi:hypothetical protein
MMLHPVTSEDLDGTIVQVDWQSHGQGTFGELEPIALVGRNLQVIRHQIKLAARHQESRVVVYFHVRIT